MKAILNTTASTMEWKGSEVSEPCYELWAGGDLIATLTFGAPSKEIATVETAEGRWTLQQAGFLRPSIMIREEASDLDLAVFHAGFLGRGRLRFTSGVTFHWRSVSTDDSTWEFRGDGGEGLVSLKLEPDTEQRPGSHLAQAHVDVTAAGHSNPRVPLLASLGWYLILLSREEQDADPPMDQVF